MLWKLLVRLWRPDPAAIAARMAALERLTDNPARARFAVMGLDGSVRLVAESPFYALGDIAHPRDTPAFDQFIRYWRIERAQDEVRTGAFYVEPDDGYTPRPSSCPGWPVLPSEREVKL